MGHSKTGERGFGKILKLDFVKVIPTCNPGLAGPKREK